MGSHGLWPCQFDCNWNLAQKDESHLGYRPKGAHCGDFEEWLLLEDEPPFLPGTSPPLGTLFLHLPIYFSDRAPWDNCRSDHAGGGQLRVATA